MDEIEPRSPGRRAAASVEVRHRKWPAIVWEQQECGRAKWHNIRCKCGTWRLAVASQDQHTCRVDFGQPPGHHCIPPGGCRQLLRGILRCRKTLHSASSVCCSGSIQHEYPRRKGKLP